MDSFEIACDFVLDNEGGYCDYEEDSGGATKFGISKRFIDSLNLGVNYPHISALTTRDAKKIYKEYFWYSGQFEKINDLEIICKIFDACVNLGMSCAVRIAQEAINIIADDVVKVDGILGSKTAITINCLDKQRFLRYYQLGLMGHYIKLCVANPSQLKFLVGWFNRVVKTPNI